MSIICRCPLFPESGLTGSTVYTNCLSVCMYVCIFRYGIVCICVHLHVHLCVHTHVRICTYYSACMFAMCLFMRLSVSV